MNGEPSKPNTPSSPIPRHNDKQIPKTREEMEAFITENAELAIRFNPLVAKTVWMIEHDFRKGKYPLPSDDSTG